jgi:catechol 2,3-dioxygenase-like lactoylglutathione lyase family enzyme
MVIDHIGVIVPDLDAAIKAVSNLGLTARVRAPARAVLDGSGGPDIELLASPPHRANHLGLHHVAFLVTDVDAAYAAAIASGARPAVEPVNVGEVRLAMVVPIEGLVVEFWTGEQRV